MRRAGRKNRRRYPRALRERYALNVELRFMRYIGKSAKSAAQAAAAARALGAAIDRARESLAGLPAEATRLFYLGDWPDDLAVRYLHAGDAVDAAQIAAQRIDFFIETSGTDDGECDESGEGEAR